MPGSWRATTAWLSSIRRAGGWCRSRSRETGPRTVRREAATAHGSDVLVPSTHRRVAAGSRPRPPSRRLNRSVDGRPPAGPVSYLYASIPSRAPIDSEDCERSYECKHTQVRRQHSPCNLVTYEPDGALEIVASVAHSCTDQPLAAARRAASCTRRVSAVRSRLLLDYVSAPVSCVYCTLLPSWYCELWV